ncbi:MAG: GNAT family N-acetyltransferase [Sphingomonas sp.]|uniref:GNAT family N-acetyltransferase n=1 Tax=Sphingomonas sp. TaxID=28214 RepID=UPI0025DB5B9B|nr:GNAT family N-acetyltransferase [Sphingomonas sp.]MBX9881649.1 GNAT family N-acetyltransferase [Sphingomonas sp.]
MRIDDAAPEDLPAILAITNAVIAGTNAIWRDAPTTIEERMAWCRGRIEAGFPVLVAREGDVLGFGSYGPFRTGDGYRFTVEHSVHVTAAARGRGIGLALMEALIARARAQGLRVMVAGVDAGADASLRLHRRLGFTEAGRLIGIGRKGGGWRDLLFLQKQLTQDD